MGLIAAAGLLSALPVRGESGDGLRLNDATGRSAISTFNAKVQRGAFTPAFEPTSRYLRSVLEYLRIPTESQILVFSSVAFRAN
jgi:hypothetical protein